MKEGPSNHYDKIYSEDRKAFGGGMPEKFVLEAARLVPKGGSVLEFGAGQGRNALALAEQGLNVKAVELSPVGVETMNKEAAEKALSSFKAEVGDARSDIEGEHDLIVSTFMLHHLTREEALDFIKRIKEHTKEGGLNALAVFMEGGDFAKLKGAEKQFYPSQEEMHELYADWEITTYTEENSRARAVKPDGSPMFNIKAEIVARKPQA